MIKVNKLKEQIIKGKPIIGTWNTLASPNITEVLAHTDLDFQIIDLEHGPFILDKISLHISACEASKSCTPLVRIPSNQDWMALQALDQGAYGIVVPHIENSQDAMKLVNSIKYYPKGNRGFTPYSKAGGFNNNNISSYIKESNDSVISVVIIESKEGLNNLEEIINIDEIDVIYFGAFDLSQDLGCSGNVTHPKVISAIQKGINLVNKKGKYAGGFVAQSEDDIKLFLDMGIRFITYQVDSSILYKDYQNISSWFQDQLL